MDRRQLIRAVPAALLATTVPVSAEPRKYTRRELIALHAHHLKALLEEEMGFPWMVMLVSDNYDQPATVVLGGQNKTHDPWGLLGAPQRHGKPCEQRHFTK